VSPGRNSRDRALFCSLDQTGRSICVAKQQPITPS
jgi:hypothetical protein